MVGTDLIMWKKRIRNTGSGADQAAEIPAGLWKVESAASRLGFKVRHLIISEVRGSFSEFEGTFTTIDGLIGSHVDATCKVASVDTGDRIRDVWIRSRDFLDVDQWPQMRLSGDLTGEDSGDGVLETKMTIRDVTLPVRFTVTVEDLRLRGKEPEADRTRMSLLAAATVSRGDFGLKFGQIMEKGGYIVDDKVALRLHVSAALQGDR